MANTSMPAPVGGWNARDSIEAIPPTDAVELVNLFPQPGAVYGRGGSLTKVTVASGHPVDTLAAFTSSTLTKFIAGCNGHLWDISDYATATSLGSGYTSDKWQTSHFNDKLIFVNGADQPQVYDGSTVSASTVSLPGIPTVTLSKVAGLMSGGAGTYAYRVSATYTNSETAASTEQTIVIDAALSAPTPTVTQASLSGGSINSATDPNPSYKITVLNEFGESLPGSAGTHANSSSQGQMGVAWTAVTGATGYKIYGRRSGSWLFMHQTDAATLSWTDDGSVTPSGAIPVADSTTAKVVVTWTASQNPSGYKVYGRTSGSELLIASVSSSTLTYTDDGSVSPSGALPASDTTGKNLFAVTNFKGRAFYIETNQCGFWYANAGAFQGNLNWFPLSFVFHRGGYVVMICTWSRDNGDGVDDLCAIISSNGEALVYQGTDPGSTLTWSLVGRFNIGVPLATRAHGKLASAEIVLTTDGFLTMDEAIVNQRAQELQTFGGKIIRAANAAATAYGSNYGWECVYYPRGNMFLVNIPIGTSQFEQYVQNTNTGAWCRFTGWNARTFAVSQNRLYFGTNDGTVVLADTNSADTAWGYGDDGTSVEHRSLQNAKFNTPGLHSQLTGVEIVSNMRYPSKASVNVYQDNRAISLPSLVDPPEQNPAQWDVSFWDTDYWATPDNTADPTNPDAKLARYSVVGYGYNLGLSFRYLCRKQQLIWYSTNFLFRPAGA